MFLFLFLLAEREDKLYRGGEGKKHTLAVTLFDAVKSRTLIRRVDDFVRDSLLPEPLPPSTAGECTSAQGSSVPTEPSYTVLLTPRRRSAGSGDLAAGLSMDLPDSAMLPRKALGVIRAFDETFIQFTSSGHIGVLALEEWLLQVAIPEHSCRFPRDAGKSFYRHACSRMARSDTLCRGSSALCPSCSR